MKLFKIYTEKFAEEIRNTNVFMESYEKSYKFTIEEKYFDITKFSNLLQHIILNENAVTKNSEKLQYIIKRKIFVDFNEKIIPRLEYFLSNNTNFYVDGFIIFGLDEFRNRIDEVLYFLVKNSLILD